MTTMRPSPIASLEARVGEHPWQTLGSAFLLGAWVALDPPRAPRNRLARTAFAMIGSVALRVMREVVLREFVERSVRDFVERAVTPMHEPTHDPMHD
jgi:hypothetical protein